MTTFDCSVGYVCKSQLCIPDCMTCNQKLNTPAVIKAFCSMNAETYWTDLVNCCGGPCPGQCTDPIQQVYQVCGGTSLANPSASCKDCLLNNCLVEYGNCKDDV
jgi:hypothetical protein